ncbi:hypothetical protein [Gimesia sp.]|uniref:hypothetical protein n=1 Tax=Gimesia sp. TaxID=2024833 RepID=UPI003A920A54
MSDDQAKDLLTEILGHYTTGSVLHLLAELYRESAEDSRQDGDELACDRFKIIEQALYVVGLGVDATNPSS